MRIGDKVDTPRGEARVLQMDVCCGPGLIVLVEKSAGEQFLIGIREITPLPVETFV